jgi:hypothetical protein
MKVLCDRLLQLLVVVIPFNGIRPFLPLGELSSEGFFFASLMYLPCVSVYLLARGSISVRVAKELLFSQATYIVLIAVSLIVAFDEIAANFHGARTGVERYALSTATYVYYLVLSLTICIHACAIGLREFLKVISTGFVALAVFLCVVSTVELMSWYVGPVKNGLTAARELFASVPERPSFRLSGVSLEPSFNAFALLACIPWVILRQVETQSVGLRWLLVGLLIFAVLSGARTAYLGLGMMAAFGVILWRGLRGKRDAVAAVVAGVLACFLLGVLVPPLALSALDEHSSVSNVTRAYLSATAVEGGLSSVPGRGFGQTGFYVVQHVSPAINMSWELLDFYEGNRSSDLPPLFSWYARSLGEFGLIGYVLLSCSVALFVYRFISRALAQRIQMTRSEVAAVAAATLTLAQFLAIGFSIESIRVPQYWLAWILCAVCIALTKEIAARGPAS